MNFSVKSIKPRQEPGKVDHFYLGGIDSYEEIGELARYWRDGAGAKIVKKDIAPDDTVYITMEYNSLIFTIVFDEFVGAYIFPESESQVEVVHEFLKRTLLFEDEQRIVA
ncbi:MAG: hypothetical protein ABFD54_05760 [Armatimonadota bacterium]|nr:hypothetical protein [bacterium]